MALRTTLAFREGLRRARTHHGHLAGGGLGGAARNRPVDHQDAAFGEAGGETHRIVGRHGDAHDEHAARSHRRRRAVLAEQHGIDLLGVHHQHDHDIAGGAEFGRSGAADGAAVDERLHNGGPHVADPHGKVRAQQRFRDPAAHRSQTHHADAGFTHESGPSARLARLDARPAPKSGQAPPPLIYPSAFPEVERTRLPGAADRRAARGNILFYGDSQ